VARVKRIESFGVINDRMALAKMHLLLTGP
jgi:hypothetical protein